MFAIPSFLLPAPIGDHGVLRAGCRPVWLGHVWATLRVALVGYLAAIVISIPLGDRHWPRRAVLSRTLYPILVIVQSTPIVAVAPIIVVTLGASTCRASSSPS